MSIDQSESAIAQDRERRRLANERFAGRSRETNIRRCILADLISFDHPDTPLGICQFASGYLRRLQPKITRQEVLEHIDKMVAAGILVRVGPNHGKVDIA